ncbi:MAG TPA: hypothetical protein VF121_13265 [Thermoanaerobaculia bacterium]|nr:hypothetical protein [Thermoanaerobaculia bacterium]
MAEAKNEYNFPDLPAESSQCAADFLTSLYSDAQFLDFLTNSAVVGDWAAHTLEGALEGVYNKALKPYDLAKANPGARTRFLRQRRQILFEMFLGRLVDNFQVYLVDLIRAVLRREPRMLQLQQPSISLEEALRYRTTDELIHRVIERKIADLSYQGFERLQEWCASRGIVLVTSEAEKGEVIELIGTRNLIAHNRCLIDEQYCTRVGIGVEKIGQPRMLESSDFLKAQALLLRIVLATDVAAVLKFRLIKVPVLLAAVDPLTEHA